MAKTKKSRKSTVDLIKKVSKKQTSSNPFEVHVNKSKFHILGQKSKNDVGLPGVSRSKAIQKRKVTLLQEYKFQDKANKFFDRRIGEHNKNMTKEDKIMARFTAEKMKAHTKQTSLFNLDDDVVLTHQGRTLEEIEQFEDPRSDEEDEDGRNMNGRLDSEFVKEAHFGGGMLSVASQDGELSRKDLITQLIADSKKRKAEKQLLKESTIKLTEQLDSEWKDLLPLLNSAKSTRPPVTTQSTTPVAPAAVVPPKPAVDKNSFDFLVKELRFEATGKPSDKLKSEEEMVRQEKQKLEQLERERLKRMNLHETDNTNARSSGRAYKSADDLDDGFAVESVNEDHNDSESDEENEEESSGEETDNEEHDDKRESENELEEENVQIEKSSVSKRGSKRKMDEDVDSETKNGSDDDDDEESGNEESEDERGDEEENDSFDDLVDNEENSDAESDEETEEVHKEVDTHKKKSKEFTKEKVIKSETSESLNENNKTVIKEIEESNEMSSDEKQPRSAGKKSLRFSTDEELCKDKGGIIVEKSKPDPKGILRNSKNQNEDVEMKNIERKESKILESDLVALASDLPFTFEVPKEYKDLLVLFEEKELCDVRTILERMIKVNHWSLGGDNKARLNQVFAFLLQYLDDCVDSLEPKKCWQALHCLTPILFDLCLMDPDSSGAYVRGVIQEKYQTYIARDTKYPSIHSLLFLKLVSTLFPTSDARHHVTTPALIFLCHALGKACPVSTRDVAVGVFLATLCVEYVDLSKRYLPELINFLQGSLLLFSHTTPLPVTKPFKSSTNHLLAIHVNELNQIPPNTDLSLTSHDLTSNENRISTLFKVKTLSALLKLVTILIEKYSGYDAAYLIFKNIAVILRHLKEEMKGEDRLRRDDSQKGDFEKKVAEKREDSSKEGKKRRSQTVEEKTEGDSVEIESNRSDCVMLKTLQDRIDEVVSQLDTTKAERPFPYVAKEKEKPKILRLFEPEIKPVLKFHTKGAQKEREKLLSKYKKEMKGAVREIRKDGRFLQKVKLKQQFRADEERKRKVKEILGGCANQEGEIRNMKRKKK